MLGEPFVEVLGDDALAVDAGCVARGGPDDRRAHEPRRVIVDSLIEMLTIRPDPASSIRGTIARATRNVPVTFVSTRSRKPLGGTSQNGCAYAGSAG